LLWPCLRQGTLMTLLVSIPSVFLAVLVAVGLDVLGIETVGVLIVEGAVGAFLGLLWLVVTRFIFRLATAS
jgi:hypothetical protein